MGTERPAAHGDGSRADHGAGGFGDTLALGASATETAMLDIIMSEFPDAASGQDAKGNLIAVIDEVPYYLNAPGLDDVDALRGIVANGPLILAGGGLRALGRRAGPAVGGAIEWLYNKDFGDSVSRRIEGAFDLAGDVVDIPYEAALDAISIDHGSKVPPRHDDVVADVVTSVIRNLAKARTGIAMEE